MANVRDDFDPGFWGPMTWKTLFVFSLGYPWTGPDQATRQHFLSFFTSLQGVIPCEKCRQGYSSFLAANPLEPRLSSKLELLKWLTALYNDKRPADSKITNLHELTKKIVKPDKTLNATIKKIKRRHPDLTF